MTAHYLETRDVPLADLAPFPGNARRGDVGRISESVERNGQYRSLVVRRNGGTLTVLAGNHTLQALARLGRTTARCEIIECDDATATRVNLVDNKAADEGDYDQDALAALLASLEDDLTGTGFTDTEAYRLISTDLPAGFPAFDETIAVSPPTVSTAAPVQLAPVAPGAQSENAVGPQAGTDRGPAQTCPSCGHVFR